MVLKWSPLAQNPPLVRKLTGLNPEAFETLHLRFSTAWIATERRRLERPGRIRAIGGGRKPALETADILLMVMVRLRLGWSFEALGRLFGVDKSTASRYVRKATPVLLEIYRSEDWTYLHPYKKGKSPDEILKEFPELKFEGSRRNKLIMQPSKLLCNQ